MPRTKPESVQELLGSDYEQGRSLVGFVATANAFMSQVVTCATDKGLTIDAVTLELMERWAAAYFYSLTDRIYTSRSTNGGSGAFLIEKNENPYKSALSNLDPTGCVNAILNHQTAGGFWLGKAASEAQTWVQRNGTEAGSYY